MSVTPEQLAAYADGELDPAAARRIEAAIADDPALRAQLAAHRALKERLVAHFAPIAQQRVPERLRQALRAGDAPAEVVDIAEGRRKTPPRRAPRWLWVAAPALAASLAIAMFGFGTQASPGYAEGALAGALDSQLAASQPRDAPVRILLSFRDRQGQFCRGFAQPERAGIACRDGRGWRLRKLIEGSGGRGGEYRQAASGNAELMAAIQQMADGAALDAQGEQDAARRGWRP